MRLSDLAFSCFVALVSVSSVTAAPANPKGLFYKQPDGSLTPSLFLKGDEYYSWMSDAKGYTVVKDDQGWYVYGKKEQGDIVSAGVRVGHTNPKKLGLVPQLQHDVELRRGLVHEQEEAEHRHLIAVPEKTLCNFNGSKASPCRLKGLVILTRFADHTDRVLASSSEYDILFNNAGPTKDKIAPTGSVADVFKENSYQTFVLESKVSDWVTIASTEAQAVDGNYGLNKPGTKTAWNQALTLAKAQFGGSFKQFDGDGNGAFDCLVMMHSGSAAEAGGIDAETGGDDTTRIWSHATGSEWYKDNEIKTSKFYVASGECQPWACQMRSIPMSVFLTFSRSILSRSAVWDIKPPGGKGTKWDTTRIAVIAHEAAHFLGLPDLYDTHGGAGAGSWDVMSESCSDYQVHDVFHQSAVAKPHPFLSCR
jgi:M6 family metalloprotease-like protein